LATYEHLDATTKFLQLSKEAMRDFKQAYLPYMLLIGGILLIFLWARSRHEGFADAASASPAAGGAYEFVMYYAEWCPHCHAAKPEFDKLGSIQTIGGKQVKIEAIEAEKNPQALKGRKVSGYPTIQLYDAQGVLVGEYAGERTQAALQAWLEAQMK
jgi:thiol-disulfide isomerase/thioredoxin